MAPQNERAAMQRTPIRPLEKKHLVINREDLHPEVKQKVQELLAARKNRIAETFPKRTDIVLGTGFLLGMNAGFSNPVVKPIAIGALASGIMLSAGAYRRGSLWVREATERVTEKGKAVEFLDKQKTIGVTHARESHPFLVVDRKGNVHLIPKTRYQAALAKAQRTFLKHVVPGRFRAKL